MALLHLSIAIFTCLAETTTGFKFINDEKSTELHN